MIEPLSPTYIQPEAHSATSGRQRRDKTNNKGQQDDEEERGIV